MAQQEELVGRVRELEGGVAARERELAVRLEAVEVRERELERKLGAVVGRERQVAARLETLGAREQELAVRLAALETRERELERGDVAARDDLAGRERELERRLELVSTRERGLARRAAAIAVRERIEPVVDAPPPAVAAEQAVSPASPVTEHHEDTGAWTLDALERLVEAASPESPERAEEWTSYLYFLREHADVDGHLPVSSTT